MPEGRTLLLMPQEYAHVWWCQKTRSSNIVDVCLGSFNCTLSIGDVQMIVFKDDKMVYCGCCQRVGVRLSSMTCIATPVEEVNATKLAKRAIVLFNLLSKALRVEVGITMNPLYLINKQQIR